MTVPKWLIPVLAGVAALAVGVAAALFAVRFAEPERTVVEPQTIEAPVLAPIVDDGTTLEELVAGAGDEVPVSPTVGIRETIDPDSVPEGALPVEFADLLDELESADDPGDVVPPAAAPAPTEPTGDPCATGEAAEGECPAGTPGTIMALDGDLPPLQIWSSGANDADCPAADEPGTVRFWARANAPVTFDMRITQGDPRRQTLETTDEQVERWLEESAEGEAWISYCIEIADLVGDRTVHVYLDATDELGRFATRALTLPVSDGLEIPPTRIHPIGDSTVFVSAPHTARTALRLLAVGATGDGDPTCDYAARHLTFPTVREPVTETVSDEYLASRDYEPDYTRRTSATFAVPASTDLIVCVGWFPAPDTRPSFERNTPLRVSEYRMTSPDVVAPRVTVSEMVLTESVPEGGIRLIGTTENGQRCGYLEAPPFTRTDDNVVCDYGALLGRFDAGGSLRITTEVDTPEGEAVNHVLLDIGLLSCVDGCSGRVRSYDVPLSKFIRPSRICSDDCRINVGETAGIVRLRAVWPASTAGTGHGWQLGDWREGAPVLDRGETPLLDTTARVTVAPGAGEREFTASTAVTVDRPVRVSAELVAYTERPELCPRPGGTTTWSSAAAGMRHEVSFTGLCAGVAYEMVVTLAEADGTTTVYRSNRGADPTASFWIHAAFTTPGVPRTIVVADAGLAIGDPARVVSVDSFEVRVAGQSARIPAHSTEQRCWVGDLRGYHSGTTGITVGEAIPVTVRVELRDASRPVNAETPVFPTRCVPEPGWTASERIEMTGWLSYDELVAGPTITLTDPETGYVATIVLSDHL